MEAPAVKPPTMKFYVRRKPVKLFNKVQEIRPCEFVKSPASSDFSRDNISKEKLEENSSSSQDRGFVIMNRIDELETPQDDSQGVHPKEEKKDSKEEFGKKYAESKVPQDNSQNVNAKGKRKNPKRTPKKQRFHRPRIMEDGRKPRNPATTRLRTISRKRKKKEKDNEEEEDEEAIIEPATPEKQSFQKRRKNEVKRKVVRTLAFNQETISSCLVELRRTPGTNFQNRKRRKARLRRADLHVLISPISLPLTICKTKSRRSKRRKNVVRWARIALSFQCLQETLSSVEIHQKDSGFSFQADVSLQNEDLIMGSKRKKGTKDIVEHHNGNGLSSPVDDPLQIEDTLMRTASCVVPKQRLKKTKARKAKAIDLSHVADVPFQIEETLMKSVSSIAPKRRNNKRSRDSIKHLIQQLNYQKDHGLSSLADVPLHIEETYMKSASYVVSEQPIRKTKDVAKLIKEMSRLNINKRITTVGKTKKKLQLVTAKVNLDPETIKEWELLMENDLPGRSYADEETESKWKGEREMFQSRIDLFINRMHLLQGNRKFKQWKGSVVDSVVGVFLTQNVSDYLSSNAFISVAAKFPVAANGGSESQAYYIKEPREVNDAVIDIEEPLEVNESVIEIEEPLEVNDSVIDDQGPTHNGNNDANSSSEFIPLPENVEEHEKSAKKKNKKTGIMEDEMVDWKSLRETHTKKGLRDMMYMDTVDWDAVRLSDQQVLATTIIKRGQHNELARKILKFLNDEAKQNGTVDLEWLRDVPSDLVKRYLLEIEGIGLKSAECVRLLGLKHSAFPVDTNVGRIAVRLGWVPLEPLPNGVKFHQLFQYPSMDAIQKYLWPRLCKLPQETLYELHYQMITFGKVFCTKVIPNCNACPMKSECKYFASAYVSSRVLLQGPKEKTHESDTTIPSYCHDADANITSKINSIEECASPECSNQTNYCEPVVEFSSSPSAEIPELIDIEDAACISSCHPYVGIPQIDIDMDALKENVVDAFLEAGKMMNSCDDDDEVSKALVALTPENACIPVELPRKEKYYHRLRTEHVVYVLPDNHELLLDFERREVDDPSPYLLTIWQPGEASYSCNPPKKKCNSDGSKLCKFKTCSYCWALREQSSNVYRGTILIPCRTAMRGGFPLNGTYFQTNEVFADHETSLRPIVFPRELCNGLEKRALYCGSSVTSIFRLLDPGRIQLCFWTGFVCMRAFNRKQRSPEELVRRLHTPPDERGKKHTKDE